MIKVPCLVCTRLYDGTTHCSVTACRACAMFFKRSATWLFVPVCKKNNNCPLEVAGKSCCSACRYKKCLEVGLKRQANARTLKSNDREEISVSKYEHNEVRLCSELSVFVPETMPTLKQFCYYYSLHANSKKEFEYIILQTEGVKLVQLPGNRMMGHMTMMRSNDLHAHCLPAFRKFLNVVFPNFTSMDTSAQDTIIHLIMFLYFDLFASFKTYKIFNDVNTSKIICSETMFADLDNINGFLGDDKFSNPMDRKTIENYFAISWRTFLNTTHKLMHRMNITDVEYLAVCALTMWDQDNFMQLLHLKPMADKHRYLIYKDLDYYYKNVLQLENYVERIMNLKELLRTLKNNLHIMKDSVHFLRAFNYYEGNEEMWHTTEKLMHALDKQSELV